MRSTLLVLLSTCGAVSSASTCKSGDANSLLQSRHSVVVHGRAGGTDASALLTSMRNTAKSLQKGSLVTMDPADVNAALATANTALQTMFPLLAQQHALAQSEIEHGIAAVQACHNQHGGEVGARIAQMATTEFARKEQCEEALGNAIEEEQAACEGQGENPNCLCNEARTAIEDRTALCAAVTDAYEGAFCENQLTCNLLHQCHGDELGIYNALRADVQTAMISRQQEYITFMQVECLMDLIMNAMLTATPIDDASLTGCDDVSVDDLTLTFPDPPPAPTACPAQSGDPQCGTLGAVHTKGNQLVSHGHVDSAGSIQFIDLGAGPFEHDGHMTGASFYVGRANQAGHKLRIYRPGHGNHYDLIAESAPIVSPVTDVIQREVFTAPLQFKAGDFYGWAHSGRGIVEFSGGDHPVRWSTDLRPSLGSVGSTINFPSGGGRVYAYQVEYTQGTGSIDTPGWNNNFGYTCSNYASHGWCADGAFVAGKEWTGQRGATHSACENTHGNPDCANLYNYPGENCVVCR